MHFRTLRVLFLTIGFLAAAEAALEVRASFRGWPTLLFGEAPRGRTEGNGFYGRTTDFPFRSRVVPRVRDPHAARIWIASASYAEDSALPPDQIFPALLEEGLDSAAVLVQVLNAARAGSTIEANIRELNQLAPEWHPDVVLLYQMSLDVDVLSKRYLSSPGKRKDVSTSGEQSRELAGGDRQRLQRWAENTTLYQLLHNSLTSMVLSERLLADGLTPKAEEEFRHLLNEFVDDVQALNAKPVLCTFATSHDERNLDRMPSGTVRFLFAYNPYLSVRGWVKETQRLNHIIEEVAQQRNVLLIDVASSVTGRPEFFNDFVHFTPAGHRRVARTMVEALRSGSFSVRPARPTRGGP